MLTISDTKLKNGIACYSGNTSAIFSTAEALELTLEQTSKILDYSHELEHEYGSNIIFWISV